MFWHRKAIAPQSQPQTTFPVCEDCVWIRPYRMHNRLDLSRCGNPKAQSESDRGGALVARVTTADDLAFCRNARSFDRQCGERAKHFEPKPKPVPPAPEPPYLGVLQNIDCSLLRIAKQLEAHAPKEKKK